MWTYFWTTRGDEMTAFFLSKLNLFVIIESKFIFFLYWNVFNLSQLLFLQEKFWTVYWSRTCWMLKKNLFHIFFICDLSLPKKCCVGTQTDKQTNDWLIRLAVLHTCNLEFDSTQQSYKNLWHICFAGYASAFRRQEYTDKNSVFTGCIMNTMYFSVKFLGFSLLQSL